MIGISNRERKMKVSEVKGPFSNFEVARLKMVPTPLNDRAVLDNNLPLGKLTPNLSAVWLIPNVRTGQGLDEQSLAELASSIASSGQREPVKAYWASHPQTGEVILAVWEGQRRTLALQVLQRLAKEPLPLYCDIGTAPEDVFAAQLTSFIREGLSALEETEAYASAWLQAQARQKGLTQKRFSERSGLEYTKVNTCTKVFKCEDLMQVWRLQPKLPRSVFVEAMRSGTTRAARAAELWNKRLGPSFEAALQSVYGDLENAGRPAPSSNSSDGGSGSGSSSNGSDSGSAGSEGSGGNGENKDGTNGNPRSRSAKTVLSVLLQYNEARQKRQDAADVAATAYLMRVATGAETDDPDTEVTVTQHVLELLVAEVFYFGATSALRACVSDSNGIPLGWPRPDNTPIPETDGGEASE